MYVIKRDGRREPVHLKKTTRTGLTNQHFDPVLVARKLCAGVCKDVTTTQLDELAAET